MALTARQETFLQEVIRGTSHRRAYKAAYPNTNMKDSTIDSEAYNMLHGIGKYRNHEITMRYHDLLDQVQKIKEEEQREHIMTRLDREELLSKIARDPNRAAADRIRAIDILNRMNGDYIHKVSIEEAIPVVLAGYDEVWD